MSITKEELRAALDATFFSHTEFRSECGDP